MRKIYSPRSHNYRIDTSEEQLRELFGEHGSIELVTIPLNKETSQPRGFAFVDFGSDEELETAVSSLDGSQYNGRVLRVSKSVPKEQIQKKERREPEGVGKIYVGNLNFKSTREEISELYAQHGEVVEVYVPTDTVTGSSRGFAFITMKEEDIEGAIEATNGIEFGGRLIVSSKPLPPGKKMNYAPKPKYTDRTKLYIGNLSFYTVADTLWSVFAEFGTVHDCYLPMDRNTGTSRGFGFVTMDKEAAQAAIDEIDGCEIDGRVIRVNEAQPKGSKELEDDSSDNTGVDMDNGEPSDEYF